MSTPKRSRPLAFRQVSWTALSFTLKMGTLHSYEALPDYTA
jgi:hypothetical protein